jgi:hypothetical protein
MNLLIRGSFLAAPPLLRFCSCAVEEKGDVWAGEVLCARHCCGVWRADDMRCEGLNGRKTGRKEERFIFGVVDPQWQFVAVMVTFGG